MRPFAWHGPLSDSGRLRLPSRPSEASVSVAELGVLLLCGAAAAGAVLLFEFKLKFPGHSILRAVFPMALGLALVPRRGSGTVMGAGAIATTAGMYFGGVGDKGLGSMTSLFMIGPFLDLALRRAVSGRRVYLALTAAGVFANLAALAVQGSAKYFGIDGGGGFKSLATWLPSAALTYPICGALAGLLSAAAWFRWNAEPRQNSADDRP